MAKVVFIFLTFAILITIISSQICDNPLIRAYGFPVLRTTVLLSGAKYCKSLNGRDSCCDATTINNFQAKANSLTNSLRNSVIIRDKFLDDIRKYSIPQLTETIRKINSVSSQAMANFARLQNITQNATVNACSNQSATNETFNKVLKYQKIRDIVGTLTGLANNITAMASELSNNFAAYQRGRTPCIKALVQLQVNAWCLACNPSYQNLGYNVLTEEINLHSQYCARLQSACYSYVENSTEQSSLVTLKFIAPIYDQLYKGLSRLANNNRAGISDLERITEGTLLTSGPSSAIQKPAVQPSSCTGRDCSWLCTNFFKRGKIDSDYLVAGGDIDPEDEEESQCSPRRILLQEHIVIEDGATQKRMLQSATFNPSNDDAPVDISFEDNPAGIDSNLGEHLMITLSSLFLFVAIIMLY